MEVIVTLQRWENFQSDLHATRLEPSEDRCYVPSFQRGTSRRTIRSHLRVLGHGEAHVALNQSAM